MKLDKILESFNNSSYFEEGEKFNVLSIEGMKHKVGSSSEGFPKVFVVTKTTKASIHNIIAELITAEYNIQCSLVDDCGEETNTVFSIITLRSTDENLRKIFFDVFTMMLYSLPMVPTDLEIALKIEGLLSIFAALKRKPIHKVQGLWAELLVIERSKKPEIVANAWHNSPEAKFDFVMGADKIEVKSTSSEERKHRFSIDQLNPSPSSKLLVASVIVRESAKDDNGLSINALYDMICKRINSIDIRMHIYSVIINTLGEEYEKANSLYFDYITGKDSLAYYESEDIPKIEKAQIPKFVSGVKFDSNLSYLDDIVKKGLMFDEGSLLGSI
jgi:hypothetical protein